VYVETSVDLVAVFFFYLGSINNEGFTFFDTSRVLIYMMVFLFSIPFESTFHARTFIPRENPPSINMLENDYDPNNNSGAQRFCHLDLPAIYQYLAGISILIPMSWFFDTIY
jgi:hypothetical protein